MDFWAQHKDFILKILAGIGIFLVALIARSIVYGDELEKEMSKNSRLQQSIASTQIAKKSEILDLQKDAERLQANAKTIAGQVGWIADDPARLTQKLLERIVRYSRHYANRSDEDVKRRAEYFRAALNEDLNGGFGQLRLTVRADLVEEAREKNIRIEKDQEEVGFGTVTSVEPDDLLQYLLELELVARVARAAIDARVDSFDEVRIAMSSGSRRDEVIPGANPDFLQQYEVSVTFTASQQAIRGVLDKLAELPSPPIIGIKADRVERPADHLKVTLDLLVISARPEVPFRKDEKKP